MEHTFGYARGDSEVIWDVKDIWKAAEKLPVEMMDVEYLYSLVEGRDEHFTEDDYARIEEADTSYPIIVNGDCTIILDGVHRIFKWKKIGGETAIKRLKRMPKPAIVKGKPFKIAGLIFTWVGQSLGKECFSNSPRSLSW